MAASAIDIPATANGRRLSAGLLALWLLASPTGLLLNNSNTPLPTPLGPIIPANANLAGRSASLIVNEVVTALPSQLNGPLAVLGDPAKVVIANPNGITCNGCSFLNTPQVQLSTGSVGFRDAGGASSSFDAATGITLQVSGGQIRIDGAGLSSYLARLDLIAETISANGPVTVSGALNLLAGRQTVDAESLAVLAAGAGNSKAGIGQDWAVDATAFGAMNAGSIRIVATPAGMGVRSAAQMAASGGDLAINANGDLTLANASASRDANLTATGAAANGGQIVAGRNLSLSAASLDNRSRVMAAGGDVDVTAPVLDNSGGFLQAGGNLSLALQGGSLDLSGTQAGTLAAGGALAIQADTLANTGSFGHTGALNLTAASITNTGLLVTQGAATLLADTIVNDGTALTAHATTSLANTGIWAAGGDATLTTSAAGNFGGTVGANRDLILHFADYTHGAGETAFLAGRNLAVSADSLTNATGCSPTSTTR